VLARAIEAIGISTVMVTMSPYLAQAVGTPRIVGVEFPFGHPLGHAGDREEQLRVIRDALRAMVEMKEPNSLVDLPYVWPEFEYWIKAWHPPEPAPITKFLREQARQRAEAKHGQEGQN
jgi:hypothetical protein